MRKIKHTHAMLQTHTQTQSPLGSPILQLQPQSQTQNQTQDQTKSQTQGQTQSLESVGPSSQFQWGACALVLLTQLMELQEAQVSAVLPSLVDMVRTHPWS